MFEIYHIADVHNWAEGPIASAKAFGNMDFLILNGDIPEHNGSVEKCRTIYELTSEIARGEVPTVFARGNHDFRVKETEFIKDVIARADEEYLAKGITHRIVVCHNPFTIRLWEPFDIEDEIYTEWTRLLAEHIHPDVIINGHMHILKIINKGDEQDHRNQPCPVVIGAAKEGKDYYAGAGFVFDNKGIEVCGTDMNGELVLKQRL